MKDNSEKLPLVICITETKMKEGGCGPPNLSGFGYGTPFSYISPRLWYDIEQKEMKFVRVGKAASAVPRRETEAGCALHFPTQNLSVMKGLYEENDRNDKEKMK